VRAMFEAFAVHRARTTGVIQWMFNAAWPKLYWQLFGYDLMPNGAYYGARKACQPQSLAYDYGRREVHAVNGTQRALTGATAEIHVLDLDSRQVFKRTLPVEVPADSAVKLVELPPIADLTPVYFLDLRLKTSDGATIASNLYWLSTTEDVLDLGASTWFYTPNSAYADFTGLARLPVVDLDAKQATTRRDGASIVSVTLRNRSSSLAFFVELQLLGQRSGRTLLPVLWEDNYVSLLPGEERTLTATIDAATLAGEEPRVRYSGWNVKQSDVPMP
jgi:exo-1,4-beta-D-glucosaminidase